MAKTKKKGTKSTKSTKTTKTKKATSKAATKEQVRKDVGEYRSGKATSGLPDRCVSVIERVLSVQETLLGLAQDVGTWTADDGKILLRTVLNHYQSGTLYWRDTLAELSSNGDLSKIKGARLVSDTQQEFQSLVRHISNVQWAFNQVVEDAAALAEAQAREEAKSKKPAKKKKTGKKTKVETTKPAKKKKGAKKGKKKAK